MNKSAILLVGGFGTRLSPLTQLTPKPMLSVAGIPFTEHQIAKARAAGISEIVLATSYLSEVFEPYFGDGTDFGIRIAYAVEENALGTGGAIRNAAEMLRGDGPVFVFNGDVLSSHDLSQQLDLHLASRADATLHLTEVEDARAFGVVELDGSRITSFNEKMENPPTHFINAGCYIFNRSVIDQIPQGRVVSVERETFPRLLTSGALVSGYLDRTYWLDIGTPAALLKATSDLIAGVAQSKAFDELMASGRFHRTAGALISRDAVIGQGALIEGGTVIEAGAQVDVGAVIKGSVIGEGAVIGRNSSISASFVAQRCEIPAGTIAEGQFFGFSPKK